MSRYTDIKELCWRWNMELPRRNLVIQTFGNVSARDPKTGVFAIKPSGVAYESLNPADIVVLDPDGNVVEGSARPSSDTATHALLYRHFPEINGIVHTHSTYATAWAQAARPIPIYGTTHADHLACDVPCTEFMADEKVKGDYEVETGNQILNCFDDIAYTEVEMVLVAGHGPFTWGKSPEKAVLNSEVLEELAKMALLTEKINPQASRLKSTLVCKHYDRKHGKNAYYGQQR